uniref:Uncharacterized protein n=1 Tax=Lactuca sativa TaxID=4236 RepID=A0A9R1UH91_LACSA|nr:hypothetical protein LSAT_V11C900462870 [Lactuca sativa]
MLKKRRRQSHIRGISIDGEWVSDPPLVKKTFYEFYATKFQPFQGVSMGRRSDGFKSLDPGVANSLAQFSLEKRSRIDNAIRINDYRPISLIGMQFKIIAKLLANSLAPVLHDVICVGAICFS